MEPFCCSLSSLSQEKLVSVAGDVDFMEQDVGGWLLASIYGLLEVSGAVSVSAGRVLSMCKSIFKMGI